MTYACATSLDNSSKEGNIFKQALDRRDYLEAEVDYRAAHRRPEDVRTTCSFAHAERLIGREYHGRFLIELLQNAADASRRTSSSSEGSRVAVWITEGPALLVANEGDPMDAEVVIESLGQIGAGTKTKGEAIGHKGIGFKSVLELTHAPEIYSGLQQSSPAMAVGFDSEQSLDKIRAASPDWDEWVVEVRGLDPDDPFAAVPVLRFPHWVEELPVEVAELRAEGYDTVVRLPFDERFAGRLGFDSEASWLKTVRSALREDVSDEILLLLGCFREVRLEDRLAGSVEEITPEWEQAPLEFGEGVTRELVRVRRNGNPSSRWRLFRQSSLERPDLSGEVAVGIRVDYNSSLEAVLPAVEGHPSAPFHLFFPTRISSGLPFLLHAYFEVDAARTGFYQGSRERNQAMLDELAAVSKAAVADVVESKSLDLASLVNRIAECSVPEDDLARDFRSDVLDLLDEVAWIPVRPEDEVSQSDRPANVFGARSSLLQRITNTFPASYVRRRTGFGFPDDGLSDAALELVMARSEAPELWEVMRLLSLPGNEPPWDGRDAVDEGFRALIDLFSALDSEDRQATRRLLNGLRGNPESRLIPTVGEGDSRVLLPVPDPSESVPGRRSRLVMARARSTGGPPLVPPASLDVAFLPDGLLPNEAELDRAKPLGVRPFTVDNVLDRLSGLEEAQIDGEALVGFLWRLLARDGSSVFSTRQSAKQAAHFDPSEWFWCRPGRARQDETTRLRQRRRRFLSAVPLPCRDGKWRPAGRIAFGSDWADWLEERADGHPTSATRDRIAAYRAMEKISPDPEALLASPGEVLSLLGGDVFQEESRGSTDDEPGETSEARQPDAERHAFLLRLGVWEVPPIEAYESQEIRNRDRFPWKESASERQREGVERGGGWQFGLHGWAGNKHNNVYLAEDYRFLWPLEEMARANGAQPDVSALVTALRHGAKLYRERSRALFFCPTCGDSGGSHRAWRYSSPDDDYPSTLAIQLGSEPWVPCTLDGERTEALASPRSVWWHPRPPSGAALRQSPWRLVPLCGPAEGMNEELRQLAGIRTLETARASTVERLMVELKERFEGGGLPVDPLRSGSARQAFIGLHRLAYERLSEVASEQPEAAAAVDRIGVLCELGEKLEYYAPGEARHDDGRFAAYVRYFLGLGTVPFAVLARDRAPVAFRLGVTPFLLELTRRGEDEGRDVTEEVRAIHGDRIAGLLAIMVHHSLGTQTLDAAGEEFERRARRIQNLRIRQMDDLVIDARVKDSSVSVTLGEGARQDLFLENPSTASPVLYHDLSGEGWQDRLRRKIAPYLAMVLENQAYAHTFALYLQQESDDEREEFLLELGITSEEVDAIKARIGAVSEEERQRHLRWFRSVLDLLGAENIALSPDPEDFAARLTNTALSAEEAHRLVELGGGEAVRRDTGEGSALRLLDRHVDLEDLDSKLREAGDQGLDIKVSRKLFARWMRANGRRLSAVLATVETEEAKAQVRSLGPPSELRFRIEPVMHDLLAPAVEALQHAGLYADGHALANRPEAELVRLAGLDNLKQLDERVSRLFSEEELRRFLGERAAMWRREVRLLAVLARTSQADTRSIIRTHDEDVTAILPQNPSSPPELREVLEELFGHHGKLAERIGACLVEAVDAPAPDREELTEWARRDGVRVDLLATVQRALDAPRRERARELMKRSQQLVEARVHPEVPHGFEKFVESGPRPISAGPGPVRTIKVTEAKSRRNKALGDEGERWALSAVVGALIELEDAERDTAIGEIQELLRRFEGPPVQEALAHAEHARMRDLDHEELIEELSGLLHVSRYSDAFGFDLIGWLPTSPDSEKRALCLEVKSSSGEGFHLSQGQWSLADQLNKDKRGDQYAVLVVRRGKTGGVPTSMDLLSNPVELVNHGHLRREVDGYQLAYRTSK